MIFMHAGVIPVTALANLQLDGKAIITITSPCMQMKKLHAEDVTDHNNLHKLVIRVNR